MPRPSDPLALIRWEAGAPRFDAKGEAGLGGWWNDHYQEARLFFLVCAQPMVENTDYPGKRALHPFIDAMLADIPKSWRDKLPHASHWGSFNTGQAADAMERRRMGLIKTLQATILIEHYLRSCGVDTSTYYDDVYIRPATYKVVREGARYTPDPTAPAIGRVAAIGQPSPGWVLTEHGEGHHVCYGAAQAIANAEAGLTIDFARRVGARGATKPACSALRYQCV